MPSPVSKRANNAGFAVSAFSDCHTVFMPQKSSSMSPLQISDQERAVFLKHMAFRFFNSCWAIYSLIFDSFSRTLFTLMIIVCLHGMGEIVFSSLMGLARVRARREKERLQQEEAARRAAERAGEEVNYFEVA
jgi:hypothetical protein